MLRSIVGAVVLVAVSACGGHSPSSGGGFVLSARAGTYSDGTGVLGLSIVATLRDAAGNGPDAPWTLALSDASGPLEVQASYGVSGPRSYVVWTFPDVLTGTGHSYDLRLTSPDGASVQTTVLVGSGELATPNPALSVDGTLLTWEPPAGATSFDCEVTSGGEVQLSSAESTGSCDVSALPAGAYVATVRAFSADVRSLLSDPSQAPMVPSLDISEAWLSFTRSDGTTPAISLSAAGGRLDDGSGQPGLALWMSLLQTDGGVSPSAWDVSVVGPGIPASSPLLLAYPANVAQTALWSYGVALSEGTYSLTASSGGQSLSAEFRVAAQAPLAEPTQVTAGAKANGGATVQWSGVPDAGSYFVGVWTHDTGAFTAGQWVRTPSADFASQTFTSGTAYDVYVTAATADLTAPPQPQTDFQASENTYSPATFTGI